MLKIQMCARQRNCNNLFNKKTTHENVGIKTILPHRLYIDLFRQ